jgi:multicomponent Na+:H+ antiporter subunit E
MFGKIKKIVVRVLNLAALFIYFCYKIIISGWIVGWSVLKGYRGENGTMVMYRPTVRSGWAFILLFSLISMTPGSLSVDVEEDNSVITVHLLDRSGEDDFLAVTMRIEKMLNRIFS